MNKNYLTQILSLNGLLCVIFSSFLLPPILISLYLGDKEAFDLFIALLAILVTGLLLWLPFKNTRSHLRRRHGFLIVTLFWLLFGALGSIPFELALNISFVDALFESVSGLTTTGATVLHNLDTMPPSILFYRQELQWLGGMGLIVFAVALLPMLGVGGISLYRAETPGPIKDDKIAPSLYKGVRALWLIYLGLTVACALSFWLAGMTVFDAVTHSLATVSTGGFSTHDASIGFYNSIAIEQIAVIFMLLGATNFGAHYVVLHNKSLRYYFMNSEVKTYILFVVATLIVVTLSVWLLDGEDSFTQSLRYTVFEVVSVITSTGFGITDFSIWPLFLPVLLIFVGFIGGCGGSTSGGMKVMRFVILVRLTYREIISLIHVKGVFPIKIENRLLPEKTLNGVLGFFSVFISSFIVLMLLMMAVGQDQITAFSAIATCMNNLGPGLGEVSQTFATINDSGKIIAVIAMLLGRLEVYSMLVLLHPAFWLE